MKITREEFETEIRKPALKKWDVGKNLIIDDCVIWWDNEGSKKCSFCKYFTVNSLVGSLQRCRCLLKPRGFKPCCKEWNNIYKAFKKYDEHKITTEEFFAVFQPNAEAIHKRISDVEYKEEWGE